MIDKTTPSVMDGPLTNVKASSGGIWVGVWHAVLNTIGSDEVVIPVMRPYRQRKAYT